MCVVANEKQPRRKTLCRKNIAKKRNEWFGHTLRHSRLFRLIIEGYVEGAKRRGRPRLKDGVMDQRSNSYKEIKKKISKGEERR